MTINDIPNINHCDVTPLYRADQTVAGYEVTAHEGWYVHFLSGDEDTANIYSVYVLIPASYDFSLVEVVPEADLPPDAVINNSDDNHEVM